MGWCLMPCSAGQRLRERARVVHTPITQNNGIKEIIPTHYHGTLTCWNAGNEQFREARSPRTPSGKAAGHPIALLTMTARCSTRGSADILQNLHLCGCSLSQFSVESTPACAQRTRCYRNAASSSPAHSLATLQNTRTLGQCPDTTSKSPRSLRLHARACSLWCDNNVEGCCCVSGPD